MKIAKLLPFFKQAKQKESSNKEYFGPFQNKQEMELYENYLKIHPEAREWNTRGVLKLAQKEAQDIQNYNNSLPADQNYRYDKNGRAYNNNFPLDKAQLKPDPTAPSNGP